MKKMFLFIILSSLFFAFCERDNPVNDDFEKKQLKSANGDTLVIKFNETINLNDGESWIKFVDVEDSRCPSNANCIWAGNAKVKLVFYDGDNENTFYLNTNGTDAFPTEAVVSNIYFELKLVSPYPDGSDISKSEYEIKLYLQYLDKLNGINTEVSAIVRDYTGLDGCGWLIELEDGSKLEPTIVLPNFQFYDGQEIVLWYSELQDYGSIYIAGQAVKIYKIESVSCPSYTTIPIGGSLDDYHADWIGMDTAFIQDKTLYISIGHSGGCAEHSYKLLIHPLMCGTPPLPKPVFWLSHNANGDSCEAFLRDTLCFNISGLNDMYSDGTEIEIRTISGSRSIVLVFE